MLAVVVAGLSFVLYFQLAPHLQPIDAAAAAAVNGERSTARATKAGASREKERPAMTFGGYPCPADCAEDKAGYQWAARNRISDPDDCTGATGAFIEGCRVYAQQQVARTAN